MSRLPRALRKPPPGVLVVDIRPVTAMFTAIVTAAAETVTAFARLLGVISVDIEAVLRERLGPGQMTDTGAWQSTACATWLHEEECPAPAPLCRCTCHGGDLR